MHRNYALFQTLQNLISANQIKRNLAIMMGSLKFTEEELRNTINAAKAFGMLKMINSLEQAGKLSRLEAEEIRKEVKQKYLNDAKRAEKVHEELRRDPYKFKFPW